MQGEEPGLWQYMRETVLLVGIIFNGDTRIKSAATLNRRQDEKIESVFLFFSLCKTRLCLVDKRWRSDSYFRLDCVEVLGSGVAVVD